MSKTIYCPRCNTNCSSIEIEDQLFSTFSAMECESCGVHWFHSDDLTKVENTYEVTLVEFRKIPGKEKQMELLTCPSCKSITMEKVIHKRDKNVTMDVCLKCKGVWLDSGELKAIQKESLVPFLGKLICWIMTC